MKIFKNYSTEKCAELLKRPEVKKLQMDALLHEIFLAVENSGDDSLFAYTKKFDGVELNSIQVSSLELEWASKNCWPDLQKAIDIAYENIKKFHAVQLNEKIIIETMPGVVCWRENRAIQKVGLYIPGGTAPLFSTVLMLGIPAQIAGCSEVILCSPPDKNGDIHPAILYAATKVGISKIYKVGGIQAIAAMTMGTESIPSVYKIFGPGNRYVTAAKQYALNYKVAIDMPAGPSEVLVVADETANPEFVAADLLSQAEHGTDSQSILLCFSNEFAELTWSAIQKQLTVLPRQVIAQAALENSKILVVENSQQAIDVCNNYAPEHLILAVENEGFYLNKLINAGSVFIGHYTPESAGDYASGTNHTLPTDGYAKSYSGISVDSFIKKITFQKISEQGLKNIGPTIETMAEAELLQAHRNAVSIRLKK